jgi:DNA polymerase III subunit epsilon
MEASRDGALYEQVFAVVDVETTGLSARMGDRICEIAVVVAHGGKVVNQLQTLVNPQKPISRGASAVNGISDAMVRTAPTFREVAAAVSQILDGAVLVAHNASFDMAFLSSEMQAAGLVPPANPVVDTLALARRCYTFPSNKLGDIARTLGINSRGLHRALADATITWQVLKRFLWDLQSQGVTTLPGLLDLQGSITSPAGWRMTPPIMEWDGGEFNPIQGLPTIIEQAVRTHSALRIRYVGSDGKQSERLVQPSKITLREQATYLVAFCHLKGEERTFRLDRIVELRIEA